MLQEDIQENLKAALKSGEKLRLSVLRDIKTSISNELVAGGRKPQETLSDEEVLEVIARLAKQRRDSIEEFSAGGRDDLVEKEEAELEILEEYLPEQMSKDELADLVDEAIEEVGAEDKSDMGQVMGKVMSQVGPATDGDSVRKLVEKKLS